MWCGQDRHRSRGRMEELEDSGAEPFVESLGKESGLAMNFTPEIASK